MKEFFKKLVNKGRVAYAALFALAVGLMVPNSARADAISDAISNFDTSNILTAGAAIITLVIAIVGIKKVIQMLKGA